MRFARRKAHPFFQFNVRQVLLLLTVTGVLLGILTPRIRRAYHLSRQHEDAHRRDAASRDLVAAVKTNDLARARRALQAGANPDYNGGTGLPSLLDSCITNGRIEMMELLLDYGAGVEPHRPNAARYGAALMLAAEHAQPPEMRREIIRRLFARGADARTPDGAMNAMDIAVRLFDAQTGDLLRKHGMPYGPREMAAFNRLDELKRAVKAETKLVHERLKPVWAGAGPTLLSIALSGGYRQMALFLIDAGAPLDVVVYSKSTLLHEAAKGGDLELVRLLIEHGLDVDATDRYSDTPLTDVVGRAEPQLVALLLEAGADVNHRGINDRTALLCAVQQGRLDIAQMLITAGADPTLPDVWGETPLHLARTKYPAIAKLLKQATAKREP